MKSPSFLVLIFSLLFFSFSNAQHFSIASNIKMKISDDLKAQFMVSLDSLLIQVNEGRIDKTLIALENQDLTIGILEELQAIEFHKKKEVKGFYKKQLINFIPIANDQYLLTISYLGQYENGNMEMAALLKLVATVEKKQVKFSIPLNYFTQKWQSKTIDGIEYFYQDKLKVERAKKFARKNKTIAQKMGLQPESFRFYMCNNYQEILSLCGIAYLLNSNGRYAEGYGVVANHIFSIRNNEDFSHDVFHYYSGKINLSKNRNWTTEEGIAYSWGNAYYTDAAGEMVEQTFLVEELKKYLTQHPDANLFELFEKRTKIFDEIASGISVRSVISGIICEEVERQKGMDGIQQLINCGRKNAMENYLAMTKELIGIDKDNFHEKVLSIIN